MLHGFLISREKAPFEVPNENFMAIILNNTDKEIVGIVEYAKEFGI